MCHKKKILVSSYENCLGTVQIELKKNNKLILKAQLIKKLNPVVTEFFIRVRKFDIFFVFITQSYFSAQTILN